MTRSRQEQLGGARLQALESGLQQTHNLSEILAIQMERLLAISLPRIKQHEIDFDKGIVSRMSQIGSALRSQLSSEALTVLADHPSDTVRGWSVFAVGEDQDVKLAKRLRCARSFAADPHFGVREWAWLAVRGAVIEAPLEAMSLLQPWADDPDPNIRRFASEATRPRGVWCRHISLLRREPERGRQLLEPLMHDQSRYVEDSVANWLNDAGKDCPNWLKQTLENWSQCGASERLVRRAGRSLKLPA